MAMGNVLTLGPYRFAVKTATFRYISDSWSGRGWDFSFAGPCVNDDPEEVFPYGAQLLAEAAPIPMENADDLTGVEIHLQLPYDDESGEPFFGLNVLEEHELSDLTLKFLSRERNMYLISISATAAETITGKPEPVTLNAWAIRQPDHAYPT